MARMPDELGQRARMDDAAQQRQDAINRFVGCGVLGLAVFAIVVLIVGYWATH